MSTQTDWQQKADTLLRLQIISQPGRDFLDCLQPDAAAYLVDKTWAENLRIIEKSDRQEAATCEHCQLGSKPWLSGNGYWMHEGGVTCQTPEKNCLCHQGSICTPACELKHHDGCKESK